MAHNNLYLINAFILVIAYRLVTNEFKNYTINPSLLLENSSKDFIIIQEFIKEDAQFMIKNIK